MADYKKMYLGLFNSITEAIEILQKAQQVAEKLYIEAPDLDIRLLHSGEPDDNKTE